SWEKEGVTRYTTEIVGDNMTMLSSKPGGGNNSERSTTSSPASQAAPSDFGAAPHATDDLPF
ncbi:MAG: single-stranded DNA-binding protein, partial [Cyclobacteriaceae bacterium]